VGYALTGETREKVLFFLLGPTDSGKTTFLEVIRMLMGDYARTTDAQTFIFGKYGARQIRNDIARLQGARFVSASEAAGGGKLDEPLVKQLTGRDTVMARFLYKEFEEFVPEFKVFLAANRMPRMTGYDEALWNRIVILPFDVRIPKDLQDRNLIHRLREELPGILAWAVQGCLEYQREGLKAPSDVRKTAEKSMKDADVIEEFIQDRCRRWSKAITAHADLHDEWTGWSAQKGIGPGSEKAFAQALDKKGFVGKRARIEGKQVRVRKGIILKSHSRAQLTMRHRESIERSRKWRELGVQ
jgi:putative DNA primase/helicase